MQKILIAFVLVETLMYASYNPFFNEPQAFEPQKQVVKTVVVKPAPKPIPKRQTLEMVYFGFVQSNKGKFALVKVGGKTIVIRKNNSIYLDERILKVNKITSNYILMKDRYSRLQTVYFSGE